MPARTRPGLLVVRGLPAVALRLLAEPQPQADLAVPQPQADLAVPQLQADPAQDTPGNA